MALSADDDKRMLSIDLIERYTYEASKDLIRTEEKLNVTK